MSGVSYGPTIPLVLTRGFSKPLRRKSLREIHSDYTYVGTKKKLSHYTLRLLVYNQIRDPLLFSVGGGVFEMTTSILNPFT